MIKTAKVVGLNSDAQAALALVSQSQTIQMSDNTGSKEASLKLYLLISTAIDDAFSKTRQTLADAEEVFVASEKLAAERLNEVLENVQDSLKEADELQILVTITQEDDSGTFLYLLYQGEAVGAYLFRGGKNINLCSMAKEGQLVSGLLKPQDRVILTTHSLVDILEGDMSVLSGTAIDSFEDEISSFLPHAQPYPIATIALEEERAVPQAEAPKPTTLQEEVRIEEVEIPVSGSFRKSKPEIKLPTAALSALPGRLASSLPHSKKAMNLVGIVLLVLVLVGLAWNFKSKKDAESRAELENQIRIATEEFNKAQQLKSLDQTASTNSLKLAKEAVDKASKIDPSSSQVLGLKKQMEGDQVLTPEQMAEIEIWLDLNLIKKDFTSKQLSLSKGRLLLLDDKNQSLVMVNLGTKAHSVLAGQDKLGEAALASLNGDTGWVYSQDKGVVKVDTTKQGAAVTVKPDSEWGEISQIYGFANNLYVLDQGKNQIWKYVPIESGYSDKREYFKKEEAVDLSGVKRFQIDMSVWVLKSGGRILKYTSGAADTFSPSGLDKPLGEPTSIFVSDQTDNLYILDSGNNRLVVLDKTGKYINQYYSDRMGEFVDLVVDEVGKKAYLLDGSKIFQMELK